MLNGYNDSLGERLNDKLRQLCALLTLAFVVLSCFRPMLDNVDIGWHVAQGRWMVQHGAIYRYDLLNYPNLGHPVINEYPLFQVVLYLFWTLGWWGPCLLTALAYALLFLVLIRTARAFDLQASSLFAMSLGLLLLYLELAFPLRPHLATYLGIVLLGTFLLRHRNTTHWLEFWPMALLQIVWTNSHSGFVLGPAMVALFGAEMTLRHGIATRTFPQKTILTWFAAFLLILLACFVNPFGAARFYPPFYQDSLESIRAYVGEMEPLSSGGAILYGYFTLLAVFVVVLSITMRRAVSWSFLLLAVLFYCEALSVKKAWPVFGLFLPLLVLSSGAFTSVNISRKIFHWLNTFGLGAVAVVMGVAVMMRFDGSSSTSIQGIWREYDQGRSELSLDAANWMKLHGIEGRLFHRSEDGGWLQEAGFDHGETFADTGFGKYPEAFIHEVGLVGERPALLPWYLTAYHPDFVVCGDFCFQWPYYLKQQNWRLIFYSPNSSVWTRPETGPDLPTISDDQVAASFDTDIAAHDRPADLRLYGRNLIALNSLGLEDFAFTKLQSLPDGLHHAPWYWEAARILCFDQPPLSVAHRNELREEAEQLHDDSLTAEFRAYCCCNADGDITAALHILEAIPPNQLSNYEAELLLKIYLDQKRPEALALARRTDCWDLRNGHHWEYLAQAEEQAGSHVAATRAWKKAVFYYPDDTLLMQHASAFAAEYPDPDLRKAIEESGKVYGK